MIAIASEIIICLLLAALLGFIIGYLLGKGSCSEEGHEEGMENNPASAVPSAVAVAASDEQGTPDGEKPMALDAPRNGAKDNLTRIKGIGLKIDETLNGVGIYHFDQIANWNDDNIAWIDNNVAFPGRVNREEWVSQAKALAAGNETEFSKRVDKGEVSSSKK